MPEHPEVNQLAPDLYSFEVPNLRGQSGQSTNVYVVGREPVTLIDAGSDDGGITAMAALSRLGIKRVARILLTHAHHDHAGSSHAIRDATGARILVAEQDLEGSGFALEPDDYLQHGDVNTSSPYTLQAISTPGHAPGHLSYYEPELKALFAGDLMSGFGSVAIVPPRGSMGHYLQSLRLIERMEIETVFPGHGPVIANGAERIREYIEHRERRESEILQLIRAGVGHLEDLTEQLYPDILPRFKPLAAGTVLAHIVHLLDSSKVRVEQEAPRLSASRFIAIEGRPVSEQTRWLTERRSNESMKVETNLREVEFGEVGKAAKLAEDLGFDGIAQSEVRRDPFISLAVAAVNTNRVELAPAVAIVFPRSPMIVAYGSRNIHEISGGRFTLGVGTQVKGHIERRFSMEWGRPGPRLREYVLALHAIWDSWEKGERLNFQGEFYNFNLMTPEFNLGPTEHGRIKVHLAAVNKYLIRTAGEIGDGLRVHSFSTPEYIRDVIWPNIIIGAKKSGRSLDTFELIGGGFMAIGADEETVIKAREWVRYRIAWYASTRTYLPVLEHHGWEGLNPELRDLIKAERWDDLAPMISDEILDTFCVSGTYDTIVDAARQRVEGITDRLSFPIPADAESASVQLRETVARLKMLASAKQF